MSAPMQLHEEATEQSPERVTPIAADRNVRLRVRQGSATRCSTLEIDAPLRHDAITQVHDALFAVRVQIVRTHAQVTLRRVVRELEIVEFDGAPLSPRRARELEQLLAREFSAVVMNDPPRSGERTVSGVRRVASSKV